MYGRYGSIFTYIYGQNQPNVGIHISYMDGMGMSSIDSALDMIEPNQVTIQGNGWWKAT